MNVGDLVAALDSRFPFRNAGAWDRVGLQVGHTTSDASSVAVCHEVTPGVIDQIRKSAIDVVIAYHPLLFAPTTSFVGGDDATGRALALAESRISLIVVHTAFDVARPGTADALFAALGLDASATFAPVDDDGGLDVGRIANLSEARSLASFAASIGEITGWNPRYNLPPDTDVSRVGVVPGSGDSFIEDAIGLVDCYVTGDVSHHGANRGRSERLAVVDAGHVPSERAGVESLYAHVVELAPGAVMLTDDAHPWRV